MLKSIINLATAVVLLFLVLVGSAILWYQIRQGGEVRAAKVENEPAIQVQTPPEDPMPRAEDPKKSDLESAASGMDQIIDASRRFREGMAEVQRVLAGEAPAETPIATLKKEEAADKPQTDPEPPAAKKPVVAEVKPDVVHVVSEGETLYGIARQHYGAGSRWPEIAKANGIADGHILKGQKLSIPGVKPPLETAENK